MLTLPEDVRAGDLIECCGRWYRLTFEYGLRRGGTLGGAMWRDRGLVAAMLTCLACLTPALVLLLGAIGLGAITGRLDLVLFPLLIGFTGFAVYRYRRVRGRKP
jgi:mercuric ion transport protein